jgi:hypothetical protein
MVLETGEIKLNLYVDKHENVTEYVDVCIQETEDEIQKPLY